MVVSQYSTSEAGNQMFAWMYQYQYSCYSIPSLIALIFRIKHDAGSTCHVAKKGGVMGSYNHSGLDIEGKMSVDHLVERADPAVLQFLRADPFPVF